jgi:AAA+ ATPase superfamily predicted ATPase
MEIKELNREMKLLFLKILQAGSINQDQADEISNFMRINGFLAFTTIKFIKYEHEKNN